MDLNPIGPIYLAKAAVCWSISWAKMAHKARAYPGYCSKKQLLAHRRLKFPVKNSTQL
jgi:hypothetical protein